MTDANVVAMPPKATIQQATGFAPAMTKLAFAGEIDDVLQGGVLFTVRAPVNSLALFGLL